MDESALRVAVVVPDDTCHGVVRHARCVARAIGGLPGVRIEEIVVPAGADAASASCVLAEDPSCTPHVVHVHVTDRLYGRDAEEAAVTLRSLLMAIRCPTVATLHDVPSPDDEPARYARRATMYRAVAALTSGLVVSSEHERRLVERLGHDADVVPLPVTVAEAAAVPPARPAGALTVGVLGFVYPGKGHDDVLDALALLGGAPTLVCIGRISDGHDDLTGVLERRARRAGVGFRLTGFVPDSRLAAELAAVDVPVVPNRNPSASASLATWLGHGRRPLVRDGAYARELDAADAGGFVRYVGDDPQQLATAIGRAARRPASTRGDGMAAHPTVSDVARLHVDVFRRAVLAAVS